jgi:hypothetical protein
MKYKVGDKVRPFDGSWTITTKDGGLKQTHGFCVNKRDFIVTATGICIPPIDYKGEFEVVEYPKGEIWVNDLAIKAIDNGEVIFINSKLVKLIPEPPKPVDFLTAVKAYAEGKTIVCKVGDYTFTYTRKDYEIDDYYEMVSYETDAGIGYKEILNGKWYIKEE